MKSPVFDSRKAIRSFRYALTGLFDLFRHENNARIHLVVATVVIIGAYFLQFTAIEWIILFLTIFFVIVAEAFNTALERLADSVSLEFHPLIKSAKDIAASGVLMAALCALLIGFFLFVPKLIALL